MGVKFIVPLPLLNNAVYRGLMPSFVCDTCQETLKKPKLDAHAAACRGAVFSCIDCYRTFAGTEYRAHTSCITETQKYVKPGVTKASSPASQPQIKAASATKEATVAETVAQVVAETGSVDLRQIKRALRTRRGMSKRDVRNMFERAVRVRQTRQGVFELSFV